jgi:hypothetical protein
MSLFPFSGQRLERCLLNWLSQVLIQTVIMMMMMMTVIIIIIIIITQTHYVITNKNIYYRPIHGKLFYYMFRPNGPSSGNILRIIMAFEVVLV